MHCAGGVTTDERDENGAPAITAGAPFRFGAG